MCFKRPLSCLFLGVVLIGIPLDGNLVKAESAADELPVQALSAAKKATQFLTQHVSTNGGYLWRYSQDLTLREGEGVVKTETVWTQPPSTPSVGEAFVRLYQATGDDQFLQAALRAAEALRQGQMRSGGWQDRVEFEPERRLRWAYRIDAPHRREKDQSSLDDDKTQSAMRFLIQLDQATHFENDSVHEMVVYAINGLLDHGQFSGGGFPQVWTSKRESKFETPLIRASYPKTWPRVYPGHQEYWSHYTLNDHLARDVVKVFLLAEKAYGRDSVLGRRCHEGLVKLADSLVAAQMPDPQPAWAQQYNSKMQPMWARKFEPASITTSESFSVIETLMLVYQVTGDSKYLQPIPAALDYLKQCEFSDGRVARFYELETNRPLYFDRNYKLTYDDSDMPTHYGFQLQSRVDHLREQYHRVRRQSVPTAIADWQDTSPPGQRKIQTVIEQLDSKGAWVTDSGLKYHRKAAPVIEMEVAVKNLNLLASYLFSRRSD